MTPHAALERGLRELALELPGGASDRFLQYLALLAKWNRTYNLTAIRDPLEMVSHHLLDSLAVAPYLPMAAEDPSIADAGSGAGLPGIALGIARPHWRVVLAESNQKKAAFLRQAAIELRLQNVGIYEGRVEAWRPATRFGVVISRAFSELAAFIAGCRHLLQPGGVLAAMKGAFPRAELDSLPDGFECAEVIALRVPLLDAERHLVLCRAKT